MHIQEKAANEFQENSKTKEIKEWIRTGKGRVITPEICDLSNMAAVINYLHATGMITDKEKEQLTKEFDA